MNMMTLAPLPSWTTLARACARRSIDEGILSAGWCHGGARAFWFSRTAWSLAVIAAAKQALNGGATPAIWVPDYFCNAALEPLRATGARLSFYPITAAMEPDYWVCRRMSADAPPDIFILVHYFGMAANAAAAAEFCEKSRAWLVEDAAHVLRPGAGVGEFGDFVLYSPHKHLPVPDGAILVARQDRPGIRMQSGEIVAALEAARQKLIASTPRRRWVHCVWLAKRCLQKVGVRAPSDGVADNTVDPLPRSLPGPEMSWLARRLLFELVSKLPRIGRERSLRRDAWNFLLSATVEGRVQAQASIAAVPYLAMFGFESAASANRFFLDLYRRRLPVTTWPDLAPEVLRDPETHQEAVGRRDKTIFLAVHQALTIQEMVDRVGYTTRGAADSVGLTLQWDGASRSDWGQWMREAGRSNLLQSWAYGEAKRQVERWNVTRGIVVRNNKPVALVQVLRKTYLGLFQVLRVNRGPVFLGSATKDDVYAATAMVGRLGSWERGRILTIAPERQLDGRTAVELATLSFRPLDLPSWSSAWIDLAPELSVIRASLDRKWRNLLTNSEKNGLVLHEDSDDESFAWIVRVHAEHMARRLFHGISVELLNALRACQGDGDDLRVLRALHDGGPVAGICLARHGIAATYLVGFSTEAGRGLRAMHFLLWQAIVRLKSEGFQWLDLGGIDHSNAPGVASFKIGMNGSSYALMGEYLCV